MLSSTASGTTSSAVLYSLEDQLDACQTLKDGCCIGCENVTSTDHCDGVDSSSFTDGGVHCTVEKLHVLPIAAEAPKKWVFAALESFMKSGTPVQQYMSFGVRRPDVSRAPEADPSNTCSHNQTAREDRSNFIDQSVTEEAQVDRGGTQTTFTYLVVACIPHSGKVTESTLIFTEGRPLQPLRRVQLLAMLHPNSYYARSAGIYSYADACRFGVSVSKVQGKENATGGNSILATTAGLEHLCGVYETSESTPIDECRLENIGVGMMQTTATVVNSHSDEVALNTVNQHNITPPNYCHGGTEHTIITPNHQIRSRGEQGENSNVFRRSWNFHGPEDVLAALLTDITPSNETRSEGTDSDSAHAFTIGTYVDSSEQYQNEIDAGSSVEVDVNHMHFKNKFDNTIGTTDGTTNAYEKTSTTIDDFRSKQRSDGLNENCGENVLASENRMAASNKSPRVRRERRVQKPACYCEQRRWRLSSLGANQSTPNGLSCNLDQNANNIRIEIEYEASVSSTAKACMPSRRTKSNGHTRYNDILERHFDVENLFSSFICPYFRARGVARSVKMQPQQEIVDFHDSTLTSGAVVSTTGVCHTNREECSVMLRNRLQNTGIHAGDSAMVVFPGKYFIIKGVSFVVWATDPANSPGFVDGDTAFFIAQDPWGEYRRIHIVPFADTLPTTYAYDLFNDYIKPYLVENPWRLYRKNDIFSFRGVEFKVIATEPSTTPPARVGPETVIHFEGSINPSILDVLPPDMMTRIRRLPARVQPFAIITAAQSLDPQLLMRVLPVYNRNLERGADEETVKNIGELLVKPFNLAEYRASTIEKRYDSFIENESHISQSDRQTSSIPWVDFTIGLNDGTASEAANDTSIECMAPMYQREGFLERGIAMPEQNAQQQSNTSFCQTEIGMVLESNPPVAASKEDKNTIENEAPSCTVCTLHLVDGDESIHLPCGHTFHWLCVRTWLRCSYTCPNCRGDLHTLVANEKRRVQDRTQQISELRNNTVGYFREIINQFMG